VTKPAKKLKSPRGLVWNRAGGLPECPYFHWSAAMFGFFSLRRHEWHGNDDPRAFHDHPHWFITIVAKGGYTDVTPGGGQDRLRRGSIRFRRAEHYHTVQDVIPGTVTYLLTGPSTRRWSFLFNGKRIMRDKYFAEHGHHRNDGQPAVRMKPDGTRIGITHEPQGVALLPAPDSRRAAVRERV
jgi:hypothetical protein